MSETGSVQYPGVFGRIHHQDTMLQSSSLQSVQHYIEVGREAYRLIEKAASLAGRRLRDVGLILDFGCGYGRVTRVLVQNIEPHFVHAFDVDPDASIFCANEFGVKSLVLADDWDSIPFSTYGVIWVGSVFTHLSEEYARGILLLFRDILAPEGLLVFTTHGAKTLRRVREGSYGERFRRLEPTIRAELESKGFSFVAYDDQEIALRLRSRGQACLASYAREVQNYGKTWMSQSFVMELVQEVFGPELQLLDFLPQGWDGHQDVFIYQRIGQM